MRIWGQLWSVYGDGDEKKKNQKRDERQQWVPENVLGQASRRKENHH